MKSILTIYDDLLSGCDQSVGFDAENMSQSELDQVKDIACIQLSVDDLANKKELLLAGQTLLERILLQFIEQSGKTAYLIALANRSAKSRVKTYKGFLRQKAEFKTGEWLDVEIDEDAGSYFVGFAKVSTQNAGACIKQARNGYFAIVILSNIDSLQIVSEQVLSSTELPFDENNTWISRKSIPALVSSDIIYCKRGIDQSGCSLYLRIFLKKTLISLYVPQLQSLS